VRPVDPRRLAFFVTSRGVTNEVYYVAQKVARFLGTNHVDNAARLCHAPSTGAMKPGGEGPAAELISCSVSMAARQAAFHGWTR
jgi:predicted molibdopterin-dependent oxidoreductase YjgC